MEIDDPRDTEIARELTLKALEPGGNSSGWLPYAMDYNGNRIGEFVGDLYATILKRVKAANTE